MHYGIGIQLFPTSWKLGVVRKKPGKLVLGAGPFRLSFYKVQE